MKYYNVRYSITLNDQQLDYLSDEDQDINRMKCFKTLVRLASMEQTTVSMKNFSAGMSIGQFAVSKVELARLWNCDRKTATRIIREFNDMDIITSVANNRTTLHTLNCLSVWFTSSGCIRNPHFKSNPKVKVKTKESKVIRKPPCVPPENSIPVTDTASDDKTNATKDSSFSLLSNSCTESSDAIIQEQTDSSVGDNSHGTYKIDQSPDGTKGNVADRKTSSEVYGSEANIKDSRVATGNGCSQPTNEREQGKV